MEDMDPGRTVVVLLFILLSSVSVDGAILSYKKFERSLTGIEKLDIDHARQLLHRQRRDASTAGAGSEKMLSNEVVLNGTEDHTQAYVHWSGKKNSEAVFILTLKYNGSRVADSQTWRSLDYGTTYHKLTISSEALISFFFVSPVDHKKMVFTDVENLRLYTSIDEMKTAPQNTSLPAASDAILMHPVKSDWMLLYDYFQRKLYVTMNFGSNWTLLQSDVNSRYFWGVNGTDDPHVVHMEIQPQDSEQAFYKRCSIPDCNSPGDGIDYNLGPFLTQTMLLTKQYIFVQKANLDGTNSHMMVSYNRDQFAHTYFPAEVKTKDFLIVDASEGQVFIAVNHGNRKGVSMYLSDPTGRRYVLSLGNVHHRAGAFWFDVDMHTVQGLNGVYLANQQLPNDHSGQIKLKSLISFDRGGTWQEVNSPKKCSSDDCALLLRLDMANYMQDWILSEEKAPGFLIAHGHYGRNYEHDLQNMSVFTSVDGGWSWNKSPLLGVYHFNILDQGSIVTAVKTGNQDMTNQVFYSYDEGATWKSEEFGKKKLIVDGVLNEPGINTVVVSIYGHASTRAAWTMVKLNFSQILSRNCAEKDYVTWMVSDHDTTVKENCLLGQEVSYKRRKPTSKCKNGEQFERTIDNKTCICGEEDFECDFGYKRQGNKCTKESWFNDGYIARDCTEGKTFKKSRGYRKVGSDKCVGGVADNDKYQPDSSANCPTVAPAHLHLVTNLTMVPTGNPIHFHLSQKMGSVHTTKYVWHFNDSHSVTVTGLSKAQTQTHSFAKAGTYHVNVSASNSGGKNVSNTVILTVEDSLHVLGVFEPGAAKVGFPVPISASSNFRPPSGVSSLHYLYHFGDEAEGERGMLTWDSYVSHTYNTSGKYTISVTAINTVSAVTRQVKINVIDDGIMVQLGFSPNVDHFVQRGHFSNARIFSLLESVRQELARMVAINLDRLGLSVNSSNPVRVNVLVLPPPDKGPEPSPEQVVQMFKDMVSNKSLTLFRNTGLPRSMGDISVTSVIVESDDSGGDGESGANYHPLYIAIPIVLLAAVVTALVLAYYRRRFRNIRRYSMVNQDEDTDALLDEEDEPPLDMRPENREGARSRDDAMLDLGTVILSQTGVSFDGGTVPHSSSA